MNAKSLTLAALLAVVVVAIVAFMLRYGDFERSATSRLATLAVEEEVLTSDIARLQESVARQDEARRMVEPSAVMKPQDKTPARADAPSPDQVRMATIEAWLGLRNSQLYAKLRLDAAKVAEFEDLEIDHWLRLEDITATARAKSLKANDPAIVALNKEEWMRFHRAQAQLLGEVAFKEVLEYQRTLPARALANALAGNVFYSDPLTAQQGEQLTRILASNSTSYSKGGPVRPGDMNLNIALGQVQTVLSPEQFAVFKRTYLASQAGQKLTPLLAGAKASPPTAPAAGRN